MPSLREIASQRLEAVAETLRAGKIPHCGSPFDSSMDFPFSWQCLLWFDAYPAPQDRHVTEFFSQFFRAGEYYGKTLGVDEFSFEGTIADGDAIYAEMRQDALSQEPLTEAYFEKLGGEHEQVVEIIRSVRANQYKRFFANLPNIGQVPNLPLGAVLETPAIADSNGMHAITQAPLPTAAAGLLATRFAWVDVVVEAALERSRTKFVEALILDGGVKSADMAAALADDLLETHRAYLPGYSGCKGDGFMPTLTIGKIRGLQQCSTPEGAIAVLALDHRGNLRQMLNPSTPNTVSEGQLTDFKRQVVGALAPAATAVLLDAEFGAGQCVASGTLPGKTGLLVSVEATGYSGDPTARHSRLMPGWSVAKAKRMGASAVKLLVYYHPEADTRADIEELVQQTAQDCREQDMPLFLEPLSYSPDPARKKLEPAERRRVVIETARRLTSSAWIYSKRNSRWITRSIWMRAPGRSPAPS